MGPTSTNAGAPPDEADTFRGVEAPGNTRRAGRSPAFPRLSASALALTALLALPAGADDGWETVANGPIVVKSKPRPNSPIRDIWAEGEINAPVQDIQAALVNAQRFTQFMPYVSESRELGKAPDGSAFVYTKLQLPFVAARDYISRVVLDEGVQPDGSGVFRQRWWAVPNHIPSRVGIVRLKVNEGSWHVTPRPGGKSWAVYKFAVDPGGNIPSFAANMGNKTGVTDTFKAVEKEARRLAEERAKKGAQPPGQAAKD